MRLLPALAGLILTGCALDPDGAPLASASVPNVTALAPRIQETFRSAKLTGYPRVSPVRRAPVSALADWIVCMTSDIDGDRVYALLIQNDLIVDYRLALIVDGCASARFEPLPGQKLVMPAPQQDDPRRGAGARASRPKN
jgi:hypothetical protein